MDRNENSEQRDKYSLIAVTSVTQVAQSLLRHCQLLRSSNSSRVYLPWEKYTCVRYINVKYRRTGQNRIGCTKNIVKISVFTVSVSYCSCCQCSRRKLPSRCCIPVSCSWCTVTHGRCGWVRCNSDWLPWAFARRIRTPFDPHCCIAFSRSRSVTANSLRGSHLYANFCMKPSYIPQYDSF